MEAWPLKAKMCIMLVAGDAANAAQSFEDDADLLLGHDVSPECLPDVPDRHLRVRASACHAAS